MEVHGVRLGASGERQGALGDAWERLASAWERQGTPRGRQETPWGAWVRLVTPVERLGVPWDLRLAPFGSAWGALRSAWNVWGGARQPVRPGSAQKRLETPVAAVAAPVPRLGAPGGRLGRAWERQGSAWRRLGAIGQRLGAPRSCWECWVRLEAPGNAWQRLPRAFVLRRSRVPGAPGDAWQQEHRLGCAWAAPAPRLGDTWEALRKAWGAPGAPLGPHTRAGIHGVLFLMAFARIGRGLCAPRGIFCKGFGPHARRTVFFFARDSGLVGTKPYFLQGIEGVRIRGGRRGGIRERRRDNRVLIFIWA